LLGVGEFVIDLEAEADPVEDPEAVPVLLTLALVVMLADLLSDELAELLLEMVLDLEIELVDEALKDRVGEFEMLLVRLLELLCDAEILGVLVVEAEGELDMVGVLLALLDPSEAVFETELVTLIEPLFDAVGDADGELDLEALGVEPPPAL